MKYLKTIRENKRECVLIEAGDFWQFYLHLSHSFYACHEFVFFIEKYFFTLSTF